MGWFDDYYVHDISEVIDFDHCPGCTCKIKRDERGAVRTLAEVLRRAEVELSVEKRQENFRKAFDKLAPKPAQQRKKP